MAILTTAQQRKAAREMAHKLFVDIGATADRSTDDLLAIVAQVDAVMDATSNQARTLYPDTAVERVFLQHVRATVPTATGAEVALAVAYWAMHRAGIA